MSISKLRLNEAKNCFPHVCSVHIAKKGFTKWFRLNELRKYAPFAALFRKSEWLNEHLFMLKHKSNVFHASHDIPSLFRLSLHLRAY